MVQHLLLLCTLCFVESVSGWTANHSPRSSSSGFVRAAPTTSASLETSTDVEIIAEDFVKPDRDPRQYRLVRLPNKLLVLLVSDAVDSGVGIEAASVHVKAGHFDDTVPGLARTFPVSYRAVVLSSFCLFFPRLSRTHAVSRDRKVSR